MEGRKEMNSEQELVYLEDNSTTNYMNPQLHEEFKWGIEHLETFTGDHGRPPMPAMSYLIMIDTQKACGLRIGETIRLTKRDFRLRNRLLDILDPKTAKGGKQKTTIPPYMIETLEIFLKRFNDEDLVFPINRQNAWRYYKDGGRNGGCEIFEEHKLRDIEGVWTHMMRKACSKFMQSLGASRELRMLKLRHAMKDAHDAYDRPDINALLKWEWENLQEDPIVIYNNKILKESTS